MDLLNQLDAVSPSAIAWSWIALNALFAVAWAYDSRTHGRLELSDKELQVHRLILIPSIGMELALVGMFWQPWLALPLFLGCYLVRTVHEVIDELRFHVDRCAPAEAAAHLVMWVTVHTKTWLVFGWAFLLGYRGWDSLHWTAYLALGLTLVVLAIIANVELLRGLPKSPKELIQALRPARERVAM